VHLYRHVCACVRACAWYSVIHSTT
jgi:hypothetical protein